MKISHQKLFKGIYLRILLFMVIAVLALLNPSGVFSVTGMVILLALFLLLIMDYKLGERGFKRQLNLQKHIFEDVVNSQPAGIYRLLQRKTLVFKPDALPPLSYEFINDRHQEITGIVNADLMADPSLIASIIFEEDKEEFFRKNNEAVRDVSYFLWEGRIKFNNKLRWLRIESTPRELPDGNVIWTGFVIDISRQKNLETQLVKREAFEWMITELSSGFVNVTQDQFDQTLEAALKRIGQFCSVDRSYVFIWDADRDILKNTHEWCATGITSQKNNLQTLQGIQVPAWMDHLKDFEPINIYDVNYMPDNWGVEQQILRKQQIRSVLVVPIISGKELIGFVGYDSVKKSRLWQDFEIQMLKLFADIIYNSMERKKAELQIRASEKKYRVLTENAFDGIYLLRNQNFDYVNQRVCEITGYAKEELLVKDFNIYKMFTEESRAFIQHRRKARLENSYIPGIYEVQLVRKDGKLRDVEISTNPLASSSDMLILGIIRDVTDRKKNINLENQVALANQTVMFKQNFLANMSHEIRTPLTGVIGMIDILSKTELSEHQIDYIYTLKQSAENLREIINQILDFSKIEAGQIKLKYRSFRSSHLFDNAKNLYSSICHKDIILKTAVQESIPAIIRADEHRVGQIISNLLSNAIKFTRKGSILLNASVDKWLDDSSLIIRISVTDTGIGIRKEKLVKLFLPFVQLENTDNRHFDGTGLGLSISKELAHLMGGEIGVDSKENQGSTFWFTFMAWRDDKEESDATGQNMAAQAKGSLQARILFAEDKAINQKVVTLMLSALGHKVEIAQNGQEVLDMFVPGKYDLILMDIQMPVMDGVTATGMLKAKYDKMLPPIVGLSANAFEGDREKYMNLGMDDYLTKPVTSDDIRRVTEKFFKKPRL